MADSVKFRSRLDFYWKSLAIFSITLLVWSFLNDTMEGREFSISFSDPISILLFGILGLTLISMILAIYKANRIIIHPDYLLFRNRIRSKKIMKEEIESIEAGREKTFTEDMYSIIRLMVKGRKRPIKIRPSMFYEEQQLAEMLLNYNSPKQKSDS